MRFWDMLVRLQGFQQQRDMLIWMANAFDAISNPDKAKYYREYAQTSQNIIDAIVAHPDPVMTYLIPYLKLHQGHTLSIDAIMAHPDLSMTYLMAFESSLGGGHTMNIG
jgi:hypothetical protein